MPRVMTVEECAEYLHVHQSTIYRMLKKGELPAFKVGSDWRFERERIDEWMRARTNNRPLASANQKR